MNFPFPPWITGTINGDLCFICALTHPQLCAQPEFPNIPMDNARLYWLFLKNAFPKCLINSGDQIPLLIFPWKFSQCGSFWGSLAASWNSVGSRKMIQGFESVGIMRNVWISGVLRIFYNSESTEYSNFYPKSPQSHCQNPNILSKV